MATTITAALTLTFGDASTQGAVQARQPLSFSLTYAEKSEKTVLVPAGSTDFAVALDTIEAPKFLLVRSLDVDVTLKLVNGVDSAPTALAGTGGWIMLCNPSGQPINSLLVTTPAAPTTGAHIDVIAFE